MKKLIVGILLISSIWGILNNRNLRLLDDVIIPNDDAYDVDSNTIEYCNKQTKEGSSDEFDDQVYHHGKSNCVEGFQIPVDVNQRGILVDEISECLTQFQDYTEEFEALLKFSNCIFDTTVEHKGGSSKDTQIYPENNENPKQINHATQNNGSIEQSTSKQQSNKKY